MLEVTIALVVTIIIGILIFKQYKTQTTLLLGGIILMTISILLNKGPLLPNDATCGSIWLDIFEFITNTFSHNNATIGLDIMAVGGFAKYMSAIGASQALVDLTIKPLKKLHAPYLVLAFGFIAGQFLNVFIPSAAGLGILLMVTMYPILISLGVSKLAATAIIGTSACLDLGPASANPILAAKIANINVSLFFVNYQIPIAIPVIIMVAILHYFLQKWHDKKHGHVIETQDHFRLDYEKLDVPKIYAILPIIPLLVLLIFSDFLISWIKLSVTTAMLLGVFISMIFELFRLKNFKKVFAGIQVFFDEMGVQFAHVIYLIVSGQTFAMGLKSIGVIDIIISSALSWDFGPGLMIIIMVAIISISAILMGSGNAPFFALASLAPDVAARSGISTISILLAMQLASSIARSMSPITSVIVAISSSAGVSPFKVVKRTVIPMLSALILMMILIFVLF